MDRLLATMTPPNPNRVSCNRDLESHKHLFFMCRYTRSVWDEVNGRAGIQWPSVQWDQVIVWATSSYNYTRNSNNKIARSLLAASVYLVWQERNMRGFRLKAGFV
ncbi:hypothetical protein OIU85_021985 [Salix viminalis]|uniref:Reverse transcriptase zinc-binding domain-containing protein n=1 Tax=Salix viminalis TaxID=40686 RepID=A0A9Q0ZE66_SALVM|nr:hypothetical protein OIU85_021985 [Salix viminalis]